MAPRIIAHLGAKDKSPFSGLPFSWTGFAKGNLDAAIKMVAIGLILGALATPLFAHWFMGAAVEIPLAKIFQQIVLTCC